MFPVISPWQYSMLTWNALSMVGSVPSLPPGTFYAAASIGSWFGTGGLWSPTATYQPGWANRFFADRAASAQRAAPYPPAPEDRAKDYVRKALARDYNAEQQRPATAYDAFSSAQHIEMNKAEQAMGVEGRDKAVWDLADSLRDWIENGERRADYNAARVHIRRTQKKREDLAAQMANVLIPGSIEVTEEVAKLILARMGTPTSDRNPDAIMADFIQKMGGKTVVRAFLDEVRAQVRSRGIPKQTRADYLAAIQDKGFNASDAAIMYEQFFRGEGDAIRRRKVDQVPEFKLERIADADRDSEYRQKARVAAMQMSGVTSKEDMEAYLEAHGEKTFSDFLTALRQAVREKKVPVRRKEAV